jgi:hypothetical protein
VDKCHHQAELSLETLAWTRGRNMPLAGLRERMMCPRCESLLEPPPVVIPKAPLADSLGILESRG